MYHHHQLAHTVEEVLGVDRLSWLHKPVLDGDVVATIHGDNEKVLWNLITSDQHSYVFHDHTHCRRGQQIIGHTRVVNPGALGGMRKQSCSFCIIDLEMGAARFVELRQRG